MGLPHLLWQVIWDQMFAPVVFDFLVYVWGNNQLDIGAEFDLTLEIQGEMGTQAREREGALTSSVRTRAN